MKAHIYFCSALLLLGQVLNAQSWHALGDGLNAPVFTIKIHNGDIYAGGYFFNAGGDPDADYLARWDGCEWHAVAPGLNGAVDAIAVSGQKVYVAGRFTMADGNGRPFKPHIAMWDGKEWSIPGGGLDYSVMDIEIIGDDVYVGGGFNWAGGIPEASLIARWDGKAWHALGSGPYFYAYDFAYVTDLATDGKSLYVVGAFENMGGVPEADRVARWDYNSERSNGAWHALGSGIDPRGLWSDHLRIVMHESNVYVSGSFTDAGGNPGADYVVRWDGNSWSGTSALAADSMTSAHTVFQNMIYCTGRNDAIKRWNIGSESWEAFALIDEVYTLAADDDNLYVGGFFKEINNKPCFSIVRWGEPEPCVFIGAVDKYIDHIEVLSVHPNPGTDRIFYTLDDQLSLTHTVTLTDITGRVVHVRVTGEREVDISGLPDGVYFLHVQDGERKEIAKVIKN